MNPFTQGTDANLYCLTTGVKVKDEIKNDLLACHEKGREWHRDFLEGCFEDGARFEKPIPRRKVKNFALEAVKSKIKIKDLKVMELQGTRDLFGRLLYISTLEKIDLEKVFQFPLTPVPLSLSHLDGSINKTDKAKLLHKLEKKTQSDVPNQADVVIVDAMFFLHTLVCPPSTYGQLSEEILRRLCAMAPIIDFVCDTYHDQSIKAAERNRRGLNESIITITGPDQKRPRDWQHALRSPSFNQALMRFLSADWSRDKHAIQLQNHQVYFAFDETCLMYTCQQNMINVNEVGSFKCQHEEADTRIIFHMYNIATNDDRCIAVRSNDTDVFILLLFHFHYLSCKPMVWMDVGLSSNNTRRLINVTQLHE